MSEKLVGYGAIALVVLFQIYCQMVFKWRISPNGITDTVSGPMPLVLKYITDPWIISGIAASFAGMLTWIVALSRIDISVAYPAAALVIPIVAILGMLLFGEAATSIKSIGIGLVFIGVLCVSIG